MDCLQSDTHVMASRLWLTGSACRINIIYWRVAETILNDNVYIVLYFSLHYKLHRPAYGIYPKPLV